MKFKKTVYNLIFGIGTQLITLALGLVIPRLILQSYGSEVNGNWFASGLMSKSLRKG